jgi:hypothetical protein
LQQHVATTLRVGVRVRVRVRARMTL